MIIGKAISPFGIKRRNGGAANDADAQAFITASGISGTNATAINTLVIDLKAANIWAKIKAAYPFVGSSATSCKWNLKSPIDSNGSYRLVFSGGGTFSANGYQPNGTNSFADTFLQPLVQNNTHLSYYSRTNAVGTGADMGNFLSAPTGAAAYIDIRGASNLFSFRLNTLGAESSFANTSSLGFAVINRVSSTQQSAFFNNVKNTFTITSTGVPTGNITIGAMQFAANTLYGNHQCAFASIGDGLTDAEALALYNAVQTFQTTLGRQV
jgi:hypothetical protein